MIRRVVVPLVVSLMLAAVVRSLPDIARYLKMREM
jgi:hypothetical protein